MVKARTGSKEEPKVQVICLLSNGIRSGIASFQKTKSSIWNASLSTWYIDSGTSSNMTKISSLLPLPVHVPLQAEMIIRSVACIEGRRDDDDDCRRTY